MRLPCLLVWAALLTSCVPGSPFIPSKANNANTNVQTPGNDAIPAEQLPTPPDDLEEEEKAMEPAIIGGAYLYCDADEAKPESDPKSMKVGCRLGNVDDSDWVAAPKQTQVINISDGSTAPCAITIPVPGSPYHIVFDADRSLQNVLELKLDVTLPQGALNMSTTINPGSLKAIAQRVGKGLALYASSGAAGDWPGMDRKTWNMWMPLKIPRSVSNIESSSRGPGGETQATVELSFDDTVCTYKTGTPKSADGPKDDKGDDYLFVSCTRAGWQPDLWVRSKSLSLRLVTDGTAGKGGITAGVVLQTEP